MNLFEAVGSSDQLVDLVSHQLEQLIADGQLKPNTLLPPQSELAQRLGVSRTVIREAVRILTTKGLLESKRGVGTRVRELTQEQIYRPLELFLRTSRGGVSFDDLHIVRTILEVEIAGLAAENATETDIAALKNIMADMESTVGQPSTFAEKDAAFHSALASATHNPLLIVLSDTVRQLLKEYLSLIIPHLDPLKQIMPYHTKILNNVATKDKEGARQSMIKHLEMVQKNHHDIYG